MDIADISYHAGSFALPRGRVESKPMAALVRTRGGVPSSDAEVAATRDAHPVDSGISATWRSVAALAALGARRSHRAAAVELRIAVADRSEASLAAIDNAAIAPAVLPVARADGAVVPSAHEDALR